VSTQPLGEEAATSRIEIGVKDIIDTSAVFGLPFVRPGSGIALFFFFNAGSPFDDEINSDAMVAVVRRLRDGLSRINR